jgi:hypothetical protein
MAPKLKLLLENQVTPVRFVSKVSSLQHWRDHLETKEKIISLQRIIGLRLNQSIANIYQAFPMSYAQF